VFDSFAAELPALFDRHAPQGRLFPHETALLAVLKEFDAPDLEALWGEDETIGWIYQYFNSKEERQTMRKASTAPRDSHELAVRNQFFTPRYVVEFLVDNTLGRLWFDWTGGETCLQDRCQYLLVKPDDQPKPAARLRDPRTVKLLDPACGSMHFGLYAFDLFLEIYREAWAWEAKHGQGSLDASTRPEAGLQPLSATYLDEAAFLRDAPRLIIEHNIYGVEIDPRAAQIASLALWLRAQRAWHDAGMKATERPAVGRGNVVAAVAPPAEVDLRKELMVEMDEIDAELFEKTLFLLKGLPELGVLLQVERELPALIRKIYREQTDFLRGGTKRWQDIENRLRTALLEFARTARSTYQSRLFAQDALEGLRLIDLSQEQFDAIVMNPPFGQPTPIAETALRQRGSDGWKDIYAGFFESAIALVSTGGMIGAITSSQYFHTRQMKNLREIMIAKGLVQSIVDLGPDVLDGAAVQTALAVLGTHRLYARMLYLDLFNNEYKNEKLIENVKSSSFSNVALEDLAAIPGKPFCLHATPNILKQWRSDNVLDPNTASVVTGNHTFDDERFLRLRQEVGNVAGSNHWVPFDKGGDYQPFYSPTSLLLKWRKGGSELKVLNEARYGSDAQVMQSSKFWYKPGLCYTHVSSVGFAPRILPSGTIFSSESIGIFLKQPGGQFNKGDALSLLGFLASRTAQELVWVFGRYRKIENRAVSGLPISLRRLQPQAKYLEDLARTGVDLCRKLESLDETSPLFVVPDALADSDTSGRTRSEIAASLREIYAKIDTCVEACLGVSEADLSAPSRAKLIPQFVTRRLGRTPKERADALLAWAVGVAFGRFDWRLATGERETPPEPDPFEPLPAKSPGMLPDGAAPLHAHPGILVDDPGQHHDLPRLIEDVFATVGYPAPEDARRWLQRDFFPHHLKQYSKSHRRAPIYWPLSTASGDYTLWLYHPTLTDQTLYTAANDFVVPKLEQTSRLATALRASSSRSGEEERRLEQLQDLEAELKELQGELLRLAPTWKPNHDDGVQITAAPLWRLFRHRPWQAALKGMWEKLETGDYDWAHLAMSCWPDRVREKCRTDKSLAIAHNLEELYEPPPEKPGTGRRGYKGRADAL
jgi:hypothetical protein